MPVEKVKTMNAASIRPKSMRVGIFAERQDIGNLDEIYDFAARRYSVRIFEGGSLGDAFELVKSSDVCWFEGLGAILAGTSHLPKACRSIARLRADEFGDQLAGRVNWPNIDVLIVDDPQAARRSIAGIEQQTQVVTLGAGKPAGEEFNQRCGLENHHSRAISRVSELFGELEKRPYHYNKEADLCRDRLIKYCRGRGLDVGCGDNKILADAIGIDIADRANEVTADALELPFEDESVDYVFSSHCLEDLADTGAALAEWMRVLRTGGNLVLYLPHKNFYPRLGTPGANPNHKQDLDPNFVLAALSETNDYEILDIDESSAGAEHSFSLVVRKLQKELPDRKILLECHAAVGDVICAEPAVRALKAKAGADTAIILRVTYPELFRNHPCVSRIEHTLLPPRCTDYQQKYELSVKPTKPNRRCHLVDRAAEQIGVELDDRVPRIYLDRWDEKMLEKFHLPRCRGPKIAISPYVYWHSRLWQCGKWAELCRKLKGQLGATIIQLGSKGAYTAEFGIDLVGQTSVREAAAVLKWCDLLVSVDTGLAHLAAAVGTHTVGIFGPVYPELRMYPGLGRAVIAADAECRGCFHWHDGDVRKCPKGHHECMKLISAEAVFNTICRVLEEAKCPDLPCETPRERPQA